jgi:hypothetical protein
VKSAKELRAEAARARAEAQALIDYAEAMDAAAAIAERGLRSRNGSDTTVAMDATVSSGRKRRGPRPRAEGKLTGIMTELGMSSLEELAEAIGAPVGTVRAAQARNSISDKLRGLIDAYRRRNQ